MLRKLLPRLALAATVLFAMPALAECGGSVQCIGVGPSPGAAQAANHGLGPDTFTLDFGSQPAGSTSAPRTIFVEAVMGPPGSMANLAPITLTGPNASDFVISGGSCSDSNGPVHGGPGCTIEVTFRPSGLGSMSATVHVPLDPPVCAGCITERVVSVVGRGTTPAPVITSPLTATGTAGTPFGGYQITATNSPTTFAASPLPPGLVMNATGFISGTPTTAGTFNTLISAGNSAGTDTRTLVFTITPPPVSGAPSVASTSLTTEYETPVTIDLATLVTGSFTGVAIASQPSNGAVTLAGTVATYTPAAGFSGDDAFTFTATGPGGTSAPGTVRVSVATLAPTANPTSITVPVNTPATLELAPFIRGSGITGITITSPPAHGTLAVDGTRVTYTPAADYFGPDAFGYAAIGNAGTSAPAVVTITVVGRPDPRRDPVVMGLLAAQEDAAQRFAAAQIGNVQRRMESLHRGTPAGSAGSLGAALAGLAASRSLDLAGMGNGFDPTCPTETNFWLGGTALFGTRDARGGFSGSDFRTSGITVGIDRRLSPRLVVGAAAGGAHDRTDLGGDGSRSRARGYSAAAYATFQPTPETFVDALVGGGMLDFDSRRELGAGARAEADRDGRQLFGSVAAGFEHRRNGVLVSPYARIDYVRDRLDAATETGGEAALTFSRQHTTSLRGAVGLRAEATHETRFGWTTPRVRAEYRHEFRDAREATLAYAGLPGEAPFIVSTRPQSRNALVLGFGNDFILRGGTTVGLDYQFQRASSGESDHGIRLLVTQEMPGRGSLRWLEGFALEASAPRDIQVDAGFAYDDNVSRGLADADRLLDRSFSVNVRKVKPMLLGNHLRGVLSATLGGEKFQRHDGLSRASAALKGELQYRASGDFGAPTFAVFAQAGTDQYESRLRDGYRYAAGVSVRQSLTDRIGVFGAVTHHRREARSEVFDGEENAVRLNLDWAVGPRSALYLSAEYRRGDIVSSNALFSPGAVHDDAFAARDLHATRFDGRTVIGTVGYNLALGAQDALDFSWRRVESKPRGELAGPYAGVGDPRYKVNQFLILYLLSF